MIQHIAQAEPGLFLITATNDSDLPETPHGCQPHPMAFKANVLCNAGQEWQERWCIRVSGLERLVKLIAESKHEWVMTVNSDELLPEIEIYNDLHE